MVFYCIKLTIFTEVQSYVKAYNDQCQTINLYLFKNS